MATEGMHGRHGFHECAGRIWTPCTCLRVNLCMPLAVFDQAVILDLRLFEWIELPVTPRQRLACLDTSDTDVTHDSQTCKAG